MSPVEKPFVPATRDELTDLALLPQHVRMLTNEVRDGFKRLVAMFENILAGRDADRDRLADIETRERHRDDRLDRLELAAGLEPLPQSRTRAPRPTPRKKR